MAGIEYGIWSCCFSLPVVVIGGDATTRKQLVDKLKNQETEYDTGVRGYHSNRPLRTVLESSENENSRMTKVRAKFWNWKISDCDADDPSASSKPKDAKLVIAIMVDKNSADKIGDLIDGDKIPCDCKVVGFVAESYTPEICCSFDGDDSGDIVFDSLTELYERYSDYHEYKGNNPGDKFRYGAKNLGSYAYAPWVVSENNEILLG